MRIAFLGLLLANVLVFGWMQWLSPSATVPVAASPGRLEDGTAGARRILLASEAPAPSTTAPALAGVVATADAASPSSADPLAPALSEAAGADSGTVIAASETASAASGAAAAATVPAVAAVSGVAGVASIAAGRTPVGAAAMPAAITGELRRCVSMGPFAALDQAGQASAMLKKDGYDPRQRSASGPVAEDYMVLIGQLKGETEQGRVVARLKRGGLDDAYALPKLKDGYAVSVGIFSQPQRAERRALAVGQVGFKAQVIERTRPGTVYWIDFDLKTPPGGAAISDPIPKASDPSQKWQVMPCPEPKSVG